MTDKEVRDKAEVILLETMLILKERLDKYQFDDCEIAPIAHEIGEISEILLRHEKEKA